MLKKLRELRMSQVTKNTNVKGNEFEGDDSPYIVGEWEVSIERTDSIHFFMHRYSKNLIDAVVVKSSFRRL